VNVRDDSEKFQWASEASSVGIKQCASFQGENAIFKSIQDEHEHFLSVISQIDEEISIQMTLDAISG
jgi:hypothetical protein